MAGIPLHITPLSYIRGTGSQYITTDFHLRSSDVVKSKWRFEGSAGNVYGCFSGSNDNDNFCLYAGAASTYAYIRYNGQLVRDFKATNGTIYEIEQGPDGFKTDGVSASFTPATFTCSAPMYIFMLPNSSSAKVTARCYGLTVYRDGDQLCNFIPARNELTGEVGFWESVGGVFYENAGTGVFGEGPEVNFSVKTLLLKRRRALTISAEEMPIFFDWLVFDTHCLLDTGLVLPLNSSVRIKIGGHESVRAGSQIIFIAGRGNSRTGFNYGGGSSATRRDTVVWYDNSNYTLISQQPPWNLVKYNFFLTPNFFGWDSTHFSTSSGLSHSTTDHFELGGYAEATATWYSGRIGITRIYGPEAASCQTDAAFESYTPIATFRPCLYKGEAGMWYVEGKRFIGKTGGTGTFSVIND